MQGTVTGTFEVQRAYHDAHWVVNPEHVWCRRGRRGSDEGWWFGVVSPPRRIAAFALALVSVGGCVALEAGRC